MFDFLKRLGKPRVDCTGSTAQTNAVTNSDNVGNNASPPGNASFPEAVPDKPVPFGYKNSWLCVKADSSEEVIEKMGMKNPRVSSWNDGVYKKRCGVFVSPVLDGYVLVIGWKGDILETDPALLDELAKKFSELHFFSTHRVSDYHVWVKYVGGEMIRGYGYCGGEGEVFLNKGNVTSEETELGLTNLIPDTEADWDSYEFPDEQNVLDVAAAWGIDTLFHRKTYPESTGFLCDIK